MLLQSLPIILTVALASLGFGHHGPEGHGELKQAAAPSSQAETAKLLSRSWRFSGGQGERQRLERAIDEVAEAMPWLIRGAAKRKLKKTQAVAERIEIAATTTDIAVTAHGRGHTIRCPADGRTVTLPHPDGGNFTASHRIVQRSLVQKLEAEGVRVGEYRLNKKGDKLTLSVEVRADKLPRPLRYTLSYTAQPQ